MCSSSQCNYNAVVKQLDYDYDTIRNAQMQDRRYLFRFHCNSSVSNAQYLRPWFTYTLRKDLSLTAHLLAARADKVDEGETTDRGYGVEYGIRANYQPYEKLILTPEAAVFTPGPYFTEYTDTELGGGFSGPVYGGRILATVSF